LRAGTESFESEHQTIKKGSVKAIKVEENAGSMRAIIFGVCNVGPWKLSVPPGSAVKEAWAKIGVSVVSGAQTSRSISVDPGQVFSAIVLKSDDGLWSYFLVGKTSLNVKQLHSWRYKEEE